MANAHANLPLSSIQDSLFPIDDGLDSPTPADHAFGDRSANETATRKPARGIARLAAQGALLSEGHRIEFHSLQARSVLNRTVSRRGLPFVWSINPYRGCEFACRYCYARYTHEFMELRHPEDFERQIFLKQNAAWLLEQELKKVRHGEQIALGTATDPYQPIERRAGVTRQLLEVFACQREITLGLVTKSTLIERDIPLLRRIAERNTLVLHLTITTPDTHLARQIEPRAPRPDLRLRTVARLRQAGLTAGILCSPVLPGITDTLQALDRIAEKAKQADASFFSAQPLFLKPCSKTVYLEFIRTHFPQLEQRYRQGFSPEGFVSEDYRSRISARVEAVMKKHGLNARPVGQSPLIPRDDQNGLFPEQPAPKTPTLVRPFEKIEPASG